MISTKIFSNKRSAKFAINAGSSIKQLYKGEVGVDGIISLVKAGVKNIQDEINSYEKSTDLYNILSRLTPEEIKMQADAAQDFFDATGLPKTYAEALQLVIDGRNNFESMPVEIKQKFNNDFNQWFATAGNKDWYEKHGVRFDSPIKAETMTPVEEVKE